jgi:isoquinoline 1-oxidoreductase beta subunit
MKADPKEFVQELEPVRNSGSGSGEGPKKMSRRVFLGTGAVAAGGALVIGFTLRKRLHPNATQETTAGEAAGVVTAKDPFDAWIHVQPDGSAELILAQSEMGQGVYTSLPMLLADEADLDWKRIRVTQSDTSLGTGGSGSVRSNFLPLRQAGAAVRTVMIAAAAQQWSVPASECTTRNSEVIHAGSKRKLSYGELVAWARKLPLPDLKTVTLKTPAQFTLIGKPTAHLDIPDKCTGTARFGLDVRLPGMVYAVIARCPIYGGSPAQFSATKALATPGVLQVFEIPARGQGTFTAGGVAVVAKSTWAALQGRKALEITWNNGPHAGESTETLRAAMTDSLAKAPAWTDGGDVALGDVAAVNRVESVYEFPFLSHACMEPMNATVHVQDGKCEAWIPSQGGVAMRSTIAKELGMAESNITVHTTLMGGGFGRRYQYDFPTEAAQIAKQVNAPVQLMWTREDDMTHDFYRPAGMRRMRGALDAQGNIVGWSDHVADVWINGQWTPPEKRKLGGDELPGTLVYPVATTRKAFSPIESAVPRAWWRSVENSFNGVAVESFVDELAHAAGQDPYLFRKRLLQLPDGRPSSVWGEDGAPDKKRLLAVMELAAQKGDWGKPLAARAGAKRGRGFACTTSYAYLAQVAEVTVDGDTIRVDRLVTAVDAGQVVNPNGARSQLEGGMMMTLSSILKEAITIRNGAAVQQNFDDYSVLRMPEAPKIETWFVESHEKPHGMGEAAVALTGPAVVNAIFAATGKRLKRMPFRMDEA